MGEGNVGGPTCNNEFAYMPKIALETFLPRNHIDQEVLDMSLLANLLLQESSVRI